MELLIEEVLLQLKRTAIIFGTGIPRSGSCFLEHAGIYIGAFRMLERSLLDSLNLTVLIDFRRTILVQHGYRLNDLFNTVLKLDIFFFTAFLNDTLTISIEHVLGRCKGGNSSCVPLRHNVITGKDTSRTGCSQCNGRTIELCQLCSSGNISLCDLLILLLFGVRIVCLDRLRHRNIMIDLFHGRCELCGCLTCNDGRATKASNPKTNKNLRSIVLESLHSSLAKPLRYNSYIFEIHIIVSS